MNLAAAIVIAFIGFNFPLCATAEENKISLRQKGPHGYEGWTFAKAKHNRDGWMNKFLIISDEKGTQTEFQAGFVFIEAWKFGPKGQYVAIRSRNSHGPALYEKFDMHSGQLIEEIVFFTENDNIPAWAKPLLDFTPRYKPD